MNLKEQASRTFQDVKLRAFREVLERGVRIKERNIHNLDAVRDYLPTGAVINEWDHLGTLDPFAVMKKLREHLGGAMKRLIVPGSYKFVDGRMGKKAEYMMKYNIDKYQVEVLPTMQHNDDTYSDEAKYENNSEVMETMLTALQQPGTVVSLAPEGTRSRTGVMNCPPNGITSLIRKSKALVFPLGIWNSERTMGLNQRLNVLEPIYFSYGPPITSADIIQESKSCGISIKDIAMLHIAQELPPEYQGYYRNVNGNFGTYYNAVFNNGKY